MVFFDKNSISSSWKQIYKDKPRNAGLAMFGVALFSIAVLFISIKGFLLFLKIKPATYSFFDFFTGLINFSKFELILLSLPIVIIASAIVLCFFLYKCLNDFIVLFKGMSVLQGSLENVEKISSGRFSYIKLKIAGKSLHARSFISGVSRYESDFPGYLLNLAPKTELLVVYHPIVKLIDEVYVREDK